MVATSGMFVHLFLFCGFQCVVPTTDCGLSGVQNTWKALKMHLILPVWANVCYPPVVVAAACGLMIECLPVVVEEQIKVGMHAPKFVLGYFNDCSITRGASPLLVH